MRDCGNSACAGLRGGAVVDRLGCSYSGTEPETSDADKATSKDLLWPPLLGGSK